MQDPDSKTVERQESSKDFTNLRNALKERYSDRHRDILIKISSLFPNITRGLLQTIPEELKLDLSLVTDAGLKKIYQEKSALYCNTLEELSFLLMICPDPKRLQLKIDQNFDCSTSPSPENMGYIQQKFKHLESLSIETNAPKRRSLDAFSFRSILELISGLKKEKQKDYLSKFHTLHLKRVSLRGAMFVRVILMTETTKHFRFDCCEFTASSPSPREIRVEGREVTILNPSFGRLKNDPENQSKVTEMLKGFIAFSGAETAGVYLKHKCPELGPGITVYNDLDDCKFSVPEIIVDHEKIREGLSMIPQSYIAYDPRTLSALPEGSVTFGNPVQQPASSSKVARKPHTHKGPRYIRLQSSQHCSERMVNGYSSEEEEEEWVLSPSSGGKRTSDYDERSGTSTKITNTPAPLQEMEEQAVGSSTSEEPPTQEQGLFTQQQQLMAWYNQLPITKPIQALAPVVSQPQAPLLASALLRQQQTVLQQVRMPCQQQPIAFSQSRQLPAPSAFEVWALQQRALEQQQMLAAIYQQPVVFYQPQGYIGNPWCNPPQTPSTTIYGNIGVTSGYNPSYPYPPHPQ